MQYILSNLAFLFLLTVMATMIAMALLHHKLHKTVIAIGIFFVGIYIFVFSVVIPEIIMEGIKKDTKVVSSIDHSSLISIDEAAKVTIHFSRANSNTLVASQEYLNEYYVQKNEIGEFVRNIVKTKSDYFEINAIFVADQKTFGKIGYVFWKNKEYVNY